jgi:hypothetical protein
MDAIWQKNTYAYCNCNAYCYNTKKCHLSHLEQTVICRL